MNKLITFAVWMLTAACLPCTLHAQNQTVSGNLTVTNTVTAGTSPDQFQFRLNGTILSTGSYTWSGGGLLSSDAQVSGPVFLWYSTKAALWAGYAASGTLTDSNIGAESVSLGDNNIASGEFAIGMGASSIVSAQSGIALGTSDIVSGNASVAVGNNNSVTGSTAVAVGCNGNATGASSVVLGHSSASGTYASAIGESNAQGAFSFAGGYSVVGGQYAAGFGASGANGNYSFAAGYSNAGGNYSCAIGDHAWTSSLNCTVFGAYNLAQGVAWGWIPTDPLFEIGNGGDGHGDGNPTATGPSDAFIVYKNGNAQLQGSLQVAPAGDIPMYAGN